MDKLLSQSKSGRAGRLWYAVCFALLGLIDQRRGSAEGTLQMTFVNLTGIVVWMLLIPSVKREFWHTKLCRVWSAVCIPGMIAGCVWGRNFWMYSGQWYTALANVVVIGWLALYILWDRREIKGKSRVNRVCLFVTAGMLILMQLSVHEALWPLWFLCLFGCFYVIGLPEGREEAFVEGMLLGIVIWFFVQQTIAFGFRPYDYVRYRGLYSGETQNGIFYMAAFCAFTGLWLLLKKRKSNIFARFLCFAFSAGCVGFQLLTGGRASFLGIVAAAMLAYMAYDIIMRESFRHWLPQGIALIACIIILFPAVYGCVRYLPTVLHHPVWFEGEYNADTSVHSYDPWDSDRYISFKHAIAENIGRMTQVFGIDLHVESGRLKYRLLFSLTVHAAEPGGPGSSPDDPFSYAGTDFSSSTSVRRAIYYYYATHLNLAGHSRDAAGFYMDNGQYYGHAHNMFLQIAYDYGLIAGILFVVWNLWCLVRLLLRRDMQGIVCALFLAAILVYGCAEMAVTPGQITMVLLFVIYYFGMQNFPREA